MFLIKVSGNRKHSEELFKGKAFVDLVSRYRGHSDSVSSLIKINDPNEGRSEYHIISPSSSVTSSVDIARCISKDKSVINISAVDQISFRDKVDLVKEVDGNSYFLSCWGLLDCDTSSLNKQIEIFMLTLSGGSTGSTTVSKSYFVVFPFENVEQSLSSLPNFAYSGKVEYYGAQCPVTPKESNLLMYKSDEYKDQNEYRFVLRNDIKATSGYLVDIKPSKPVYIGSYDIRGEEHYFVLKTCLTNTEF